MICIIVFFIFFYPIATFVYFNVSYFILFKTLIFWKLFENRSSSVPDQAVYTIWFCIFKTLLKYKYEINKNNGLTLKNITDVFLKNKKIRIREPGVRLLMVYFILVNNWIKDAIRDGFVVKLYFSTHILCPLYCCISNTTMCIRRV